MNATGRRIGPLGTGARILVGFALLYLAGAIDGLPWGVEWFDPVVGLLVLPAIMVGVGLAARRYVAGPLRVTGPLGIALNLAVIVALISNEYTGGGATLFYGATMLIAAWQGQPGCESTVVSNLVLRRDDQLGCPIFWPIDELEERMRSARAAATARENSRSAWWHPLVHLVVCLGVGALVALVVILS
jgi:hypothetical protein